MPSLMFEKAKKQYKFLKDIYKILGKAIMFGQNTLGSDHALTLCSCLH